MKSLLSEILLIYYSIIQWYSVSADFMWDTEQKFYVQI